MNGNYRVVAGDIFKSVGAHYGSRSRCDNGVVKCYIFRAVPLVVAVLVGERKYTVGPFLEVA